MAPWHYGGGPESRMWTDTGLFRDLLSQAAKRFQTASDLDYTDRTDYSLLIFSLSVFSLSISFF